MSLSWVKLITSGSDAELNNITASGYITSSDISIDDWGSISASLSTISSGVGTLDQVTDIGNTTTNAISSSGGFYGTSSWAENTITASYALTASYIEGGGGGGGGVAYHTQASPNITWSFSHNLNVERPIIAVYDSNNYIIIPEEIRGVNSNNVEIYFPLSQSGFATAIGGVATGTGSNANTGSIIEFTDESTWSFSHNLNNRFVIIQILDSNYNQVIPQNIYRQDANTAIITFPISESGWAIAK